MDTAKSFWDKKYRDNASKLIGVCRRYVQDRELAEDLVQEAFLTAINKYHTYTGKGSFEGWLRQIVINTALMHIRKEKANKENEAIRNEDSAEPFDDSENEDLKSIISRAEFSDEELFAAIDCLPLHHKMVFNLYVIDNYSHKQIAMELNISEGTSKSHLARARKKLQEILQTKAKGKKLKLLSMAVLLSSLAKAGTIDKIFKAGLKGAEIHTLKYPNLCLDQINWNAQLVPNILKKQVLYVTSKLIKYVIIPSATVSIMFYTGKRLEDKPNNGHKLELKFSNDKFDSIKQRTLLTDSLDNTESEVVTKNFEDSTTNTPVLVKKKIIQKQTIKVNNTIQIYDSISTP